MMQMIIEQQQRRRKRVANVTYTYRSNDDTTDSKLELVQEEQRQEKLRQHEQKQHASHNIWQQQQARFTRGCIRWLKCVHPENEYKPRFHLTGPWCGVCGDWLKDAGSDEHRKTTER